MKKINLKSRFAFTLVELVFVIVTIGILAAIIVPSMQSSRLREAADQVISHIRHTQHLAMMDDKFNPTDGNWYKKRWQILFEEVDGDSWSYTIFSDRSDIVALDGVPQQDEIAVNPQDSSKRLTGGSGTIDISSAFVTRDLNLGRTYGIKGGNGIKFDNCNNNAGDLRIVFDYLGRPISGNPFVHSAPYSNNTLIASASPDLCTITIMDESGDSLNITIEPETGFAKVI
jgi:type II secretory pathway pseudopilin PulG